MLHEMTACIEFSMDDFQGSNAGAKVCACNGKRCNAMPLPVEFTRLLDEQVDSADDDKTFEGVREAGIDPEGKSELSPMSGGDESSFLDGEKKMGTNAFGGRRDRSENKQRPPTIPPRNGEGRLTISGEETMNHPVAEEHMEGKTAELLEMIMI